MPLIALDDDKLPYSRLLSPHTVSNQLTVLVVLMEIVLLLSSGSDLIGCCLMVEETAMDIDVVVILWGCFTVVGWTSFGIVVVAYCSPGNCCIGSSLTMACSTILGGMGGYTLPIMPCIMSNSSVGFPPLSLFC